jgi:hypothetical protein
VRLPSPTRDATARWRAGGWEASRRDGRPRGCSGVESKADSGALIEYWQMAAASGAMRGL